MPDVTRFRVGDYEFTDYDVIRPEDHVYRPNRGKKGDKTGPYSGIEARADIVRAENSDGEEVLLKINRHDYLTPWPVSPADNISVMREIAGIEHENLLTPDEVLHEPVHRVREHSNGEYLSQASDFKIVDSYYDEEGEYQVERGEERVVEVYSDIIEQPTLAEWAEPPVDSETARHIVGDILEAAAELNDRDVMHFDIRMPNVFIDPETREATLYDFNISTPPFDYEGHAKDDGYLRHPPEFMDGGEIDFQYDVWKTGVLWAKLVLETKSYKIVGPSEETVSNQDREAMMQSYDADREVRFADCREMLDAVR